MKQSIIFILLIFSLSCVAQDYEKQKEKFIKRIIDTLKTKSSISRWEIRSKNYASQRRFT